MNKIINKIINKILLYEVAGTAAVLLSVIVILKIILAVTFKEYKDIEQNPVPPTEKAVSIKFLQYNAFWRPGLIHMGREEYVRERSLLVLDKIEGYDVVCLNEAFHFGSTIVKNFVVAAKQRGFKYVVSSKKLPFLTYQIIDSGLLILSKYPIVDSGSIRFRDGCGVDAFSAKGVVYAKVQISATMHIHVFTTHIQASYQPGPTVQDVQTRSKQVDHLSRFMAEKVNDTFPVLILGDFNVNSRKGKEYTTLIQHLILEGYYLVDTLYSSKNEHVITFGESRGNWHADEVLTVPPDRGTNQSLDYIFLFRNINSTIDVNFNTTINKMTIEGKIYPQLSDHYGVESTMTFVDS